MLLEVCYFLPYTVRYFVSPEMYLVYQTTNSMLLQVFFHVDKLQMINFLTLKVKCVKKCQKYVFEEFYFVCFYFILTMKKIGL